MIQKKQFIITPIINGKEISQKKFLVTKGIIKQLWESAGMALIRYALVLIAGIYIGAVL